MKSQLKKRRNSLRNEFSDWRVRNLVHKNQWVALFAQKLLTHKVSKDKWGRKMKNASRFLSALRPALIAVSLGFGCAGGLSAQIQTFTPLPSPNCGTVTSFALTSNCITFGDFNVYSLALLYAQTTFASTGIVPTTNANPGDPFHVKSAPGELGNAGYIVFATGTNNNGVVTNGNGTLIDDAQQSSSGNASQPPLISGPSTETSPAFLGDSQNTWDATLSAMRAELGNGTGDFAMYFNLNETGQDGLAGLDLLTWLRVTLTDADGILPNQSFYLTGSTGSTTAPTNSADPNYVYVHGSICISSTAGFLGFGPCTTAQTALGGRNVNQNLGANQAAFAISNPTLSALVLDANSGYEFFRASWQIAETNNGYEQFFAALTPSQSVPTPGVVLLLGIGLLGGLRVARRASR
jgi:hypothetical protein